MKKIKLSFSVMNGSDESAGNYGRAAGEGGGGVVVRLDFNSIIEFSDLSHRCHAIVVSRS